MCGRQPLELSLRRSTTEDRGRHRSAGEPDRDPLIDDGRSTRIAPVRGSPRPSRRAPWSCDSQPGSAWNVLFDCHRESRSEPRTRKGRCRSMSVASVHSGVRVIYRVGALLDAFAAANGPQTVVQLAETTGEPRTTIYRLLATLQPMGWVEETPKRGRYVLGLQLRQLGRAVVESEPARRMSPSVFRSVRHDTGPVVYLTCSACGRNAWSAWTLSR